MDTNIAWTRAYTSTHALKQKCAQAQACTGTCAPPYRKRSRLLDACYTLSLHKITCSGHSCRSSRARAPSRQAGPACVRSMLQQQVEGLLEKRVARDFSD